MKLYNHSLEEIIENKRKSKSKKKRKRKSYGDKG